MFNCRTLILSFIPIEIVPQRDLRWWTRRQILPFIQFFSTFQSFSSYNAICWKCPLKNDCVRSCLIELQSFFDDSKININPEYRILRLCSSGSSRLSPSGFEAHPGRTPFHPCAVLPRPASAHFPPLRWPDCTLSRLRAEEYDRPVTQSIATLEPSSRTIPTLRSDAGRPLEP